MAFEILHRVCLKGGARIRESLYERQLLFLLTTCYSKDRVVLVRGRRKASRKSDGSDV
jgi:hypothetical protein